MENIQLFIDKQRYLAKKYEVFFKDTNIDFIKEPKDSKSNYWLNTVILKDRQTRDEFLKYTNDNGIMVRPIWRLMNKLDMFKDAQTDGLDNSKWLEDRVVNISSSVIL